MIWLSNASPTNPQYLVEGAKIPFSVVYENATSVTVGSVAIYRNGTGADYAGTAMPSGSHTDNGVDTVTMKSLNAITGDGGKVYVLVLTSTVNSNTDVRKGYFKIEKPKKKY